MSKKSPSEKRSSITRKLGTDPTFDPPKSHSTLETESIISTDAASKINTTTRVPTEGNFLQKAKEYLESVGVIIGFAITIGSGIAAYFIFKNEIEAADKDISEIKQKISNQDEKIVEMRVFNATTSKDIESTKNAIQEMNKSIGGIQESVSSMKSEQAVITDRINRK